MTGLRPMREGDWGAVQEIYRQGIEAGNATFETEPPSWEHFDAGKRADLRLVAVQGDEVVGWAAASPVSSREVYRGVVEHSVYVEEGHQGQGIGRLLLDGFLDLAARQGVWTVQSSIFPENVASLRLHEACGFRTVGRRERIALMQTGPWAGRWRDTILIERRA
ncbi:GNAT family N-acetyltransferase [Protaetiibacter mangrovi]|uniref:GNAT family N-acetyltransferase n=1 Tax=Protaetiibacter mangrovi TaxID=2970926 RepID=A0ABT1ZCY5_9MICO|nr:GNAT family N-acetyltransferase [Protaetiibacter mangrovi]MCS0498567.1 GNAT family N-acetyltransferase [Protaetiibacter mangrovi]TPX03988.1 N-acetyltransferase [Schumannella luteola]